jgi:hypothetical protein
VDEPSVSLLTLGEEHRLQLRRCEDKSLAFPTLPACGLQYNQKIFFLDELKKLGHQSHKCLELKGEYVE